MHRHQLRQVYIQSHVQTNDVYQTSSRFLLCFRLACSRRCFCERIQQGTSRNQGKENRFPQPQVHLCIYEFINPIFSHIAISAFQVALQVRQSAVLFPSVNKDKRSLCLSTGGVSCIRTLPLLFGLNIKSSTTPTHLSLRIRSTLPFHHPPHCHLQLPLSSSTPIHQVCFFLSLVHYTRHHHALSLQILHTHWHPDNNRLSAVALLRA
jgi:hypothetical protein